MNSLRDLIYTGIAKQAGFKVPGMLKSVKKVSKVKPPKPAAAVESTFSTDGPKPNFLPSTKVRNPSAPKLQTINKPGIQPRTKALAGIGIMGGGTAYAIRDKKRG